MKKFDIINFFFIMLLEDVTTVYEVSIQWTMRAKECRRVSRSVSRIYKVCISTTKKEVKMIEITNFFFTMLLVEVTTVFEE